MNMIVKRLTLMVLVGIFSSACFGAINDPNDIPNLYFWVRADSIIGEIDGNFVTSWTDESSSGFSLAVPGGASAPTYRAGTSSSRHGHPAVHISGENLLEGLDTTTNFGLMGDPDYTIFYVGNVISMNVGTPRILQWGSGADVAGFVALGTNYDPDVPQNRIVVSGGSWKDASTPLQSLEPYMGKLSTIMVSHGSGEQIGQMRISYNGNNQTVTGVTETSNIVTATPLSIGNQDAGAYPAAADVFEVIIYNRKLNDTEIQDVLNYVEAKYVPTWTLTDPNEVPNLYFWVKADTIMGLNNGDNVTAWADQSASGFDLSLPGGVTAPTYRDEANSLIVATHPAVHFAGGGGDEYLNTGSLGDPNFGLDGDPDFTIIWASVIENLNGDFRANMSWGTGDNFGHAVILTTDYAAGGQASKSYNINTGFGRNIETFTDSYVPYLNQFAIISVVHQSGDLIDRMKIVYNQLYQKTTTPGGNGFMDITNTPLYVGGDPALTEVVNSPTGDLFELLI